VAAVDPSARKRRREAVPVSILRRYVSGEILRAFLLALLTMTSIFVLFMVAAEAMRSRLLTPQDIAELVPYIVPSTLPYTIPVSLLFAVTVVYGRIAGDNEIIAVKSAGLSVMTVIWPTILLATCLSGGLWFISRGYIPGSAHCAKVVIFKDLEDTFYKFLKRDREFNNPRWPFLIKVRDVEGKVMIDATFKKRARDKDNRETYSATIQAKRAELHFDLVHKVVRVHLDQAELQNYGKEEDLALINRRILEIDIPQESQFVPEKAVQEYTNQEIDDELAKARERIAKDRKRQALTVAFQFATGRFDEVNWGVVQKTQADHAYFQKRVHEFETEKELRTSMSLGSLLFVILGAPVGILFARRDFLSAFISCFVPIITLYYPLTLLGVNLGKEGTMPPLPALWFGNIVLVLLSLWAYPKILKH
jgi:lipopolysaccharide export system permease protein